MSDSPHDPCKDCPGPGGLATSRELNTVQTSFVGNRLFYTTVILFAGFIAGSTASITFLAKSVAVQDQMHVNTIAAMSQLQKTQSETNKVIGTLSREIQVRQNVVDIQYRQLKNMAERNKEHIIELETKR